ncbi:hypothetical protein DL95DRAFT_406239 [Leptodontidium sp. 2 PMI_412]|nr:hypothetical protein BKA61DRAFT_568307 [Leptodontidium sp. MPI-SDFR-AT-0119]KAH9217891.1 hypothetical protein DL95DRAFT_406239 [Leptodontidium sp. 2 PMI_412]
MVEVVQRLVSFLLVPVRTLSNESPSPAARDCCCLLKLFSGIRFSFLRAKSESMCVFGIDEAKWVEIRRSLHARADAGQRLAGFPTSGTPSSSRICWVCITVIS